MLTIMNITAVNKTVPCIMGKSRDRIELIASSPIPGQLKIYSIKKVPPSKAASHALIVVITGLSAFRKACLIITFHSLTPLALAVLT